MDLTNSVEPVPTTGELRGRATVSVPTMLETKRRLRLHHEMLWSLASRYRQINQEQKAKKCEQLAKLFEAAEAAVMVAAEEVKATLT